MATKSGKNATFLKIAQELSMLSTCHRRQVGAVLTDKHYHIIGSGYNGVPIGAIHCTDEPCGGANKPSGEGLGLCLAIHAEQNALMQCKNMHDIHTLYVTTSPCEHCIKMLMNTSCKYIVYHHEYPHKRVFDMWSRHGGEWIKLNI